MAMESARRCPVESELEAEERVFLLTLRFWLASAFSWHSFYRERAWNELSEVLHPGRALVALSALDCLLRTIANHAARKLKFRPPGFGCIAPDELCLIDLVALGQIGAIDPMRQIAGKLVMPGGVTEVIGASRQLADMLISGGLILSDRNLAERPATEEAHHPDLPNAFLH